MERRSAPTSSAKWEEVRDASFQVVLLTQRKDDFWSLPTATVELKDTWAPVGTREHAQRSVSFGHPSITVSVNALTALEACTGTLPMWVIPRALEAIETYRGPQGAYGTPIPRLGRLEINAVPRHTAMAAVAHLLFSTAAHSSALASHLEPTVRWLLGSKRKAGGWPYDLSGLSELGFMSTASAVCAMALYLKLPGVRASLADRLKAAVNRGFDALVASAQRGLWHGDGSPPASQLRDSALALRLLLFARNLGCLEECCSGAGQVIDQLLREFSSHAILGGWPDRAGDARPSVAGTISSLLLYAGHESLSGDALICSAEGLIFREIEEGTLSLHLSAWDWQCLALLAAARARPIPDKRRRTLIDQCEELRRRSTAGRIGARDLVQMLEPARGAVAFALTGGIGIAPSERFPRLRRRGCKIAQVIFHETVSKLVFAAIFFLLSWLLFGTTISQYLHRLLSDLH
jgi:hypothetical protein